MKAVFNLLVIGACLFAAWKFADQPGGRPQVASRPAGLPTDLTMSPDALAGLSQITPSKVVLFSAEWCPNCKKVKKLLDQQGVRFTELDIERDARSAEFQRQNMQIQGFPVLVVGERIIGGYDEPTILAALKGL